MPRQVELENGQIRYQCDVCFWSFFREELAVACARLDRGQSPTDSTDAEVLDVDFS
jgi:hypothetical protein